MNDIDIFVKISDLLSTVSSKCVSIATLKQQVSCVLHNNCIHEIIEDMIDVDVDKSHIIYYCNNCFLTFDINYIYNYIIFSLTAFDKDKWLILYNKEYYKLLSVRVQNNNLKFSIILKEDLVDICFSLHQLFRCKVLSNIVLIHG